MARRRSGGGPAVGSRGADESSARRVASYGWALGAALMLLGSPAATAAPSTLAPPRAWTAEQARPLLDKTLPVELAPDLSGLPANERAAVEKLIAAGRIMHHLSEDMDHRDAARARRDLAAAERARVREPRVEALSRLYDLFEGPIATTLENRRVPFLAVDSLVPGKAFYPWGITKAEIDAFLELHPEQREEILDVRTVVRRADAASLRADLAVLGRHPALDVLHPGLADHLRALARRPAPRTLYAVPYAVAHADSCLATYRLLNQAAALAEPSDRQFADYLRLRARDLLANDYQAGDAAWVKGRFRRLNAQIGAYETYSDELYGAKAGYGMSILLADEPRTRAVRDAIQGLQDFENALPYPSHKKVIEDIPVGVYDVIADFGQCRSANTATILPNESEHARRYGRIIMMRRNIMADSGIVAAARRAFESALDPRHHGDFDPDGSFHRVLWHEIGHYLGPDQDRQGRELDQALEEHSNTLEEMKADLVSLFVARDLRRRGYYDDRKLRAVYASGILRTLNRNRPRPDQSYGVMQLMQLNWFLDQGVLVYAPEARKLTVRYERYHEAVAKLIEQVLAIQLDGDRAAAAGFIARWTIWDDRHEALARGLRESETSRYRLMRYAALEGEEAAP